MECSGGVEWNCSVTYLIFLFIPISMGGVEMPNISNWLTSESPDKMVSWLNIMETISYVNPGSKRKVESVVNAILNSSFDRPDPYTLMSYPRSVYLQSIRNHDQHYGAISEKIKSKVFAAAWHANASRSHKAFVSEFLSSGTWDCSVLGMMASCLPFSWRTGLISRIQNNEVVIRCAFPMR